MPNLPRSSGRVVNTAADDIGRAGKPARPLLVGIASDALGY